MGFFDHFLNAADLLLKHQRHVDAMEAEAREEARSMRGSKRKVKMPDAEPRQQRHSRGAFADSSDPDCCIASRKLKR